MTTGMKAFAEGSKAGHLSDAPVNEDESLNEAEKRRRLDMEMFREVFGPKGARTKAQEHVLKRLAFESYVDRPFSLPGRPASEQEFFAREGMRTFFLWMRELADSDFQPAKKRPVKIDRRRRLSTGKEKE